MSPTTFASFNLYRVSDWVACNPTATRFISVGLAITVALAALLLGQDVSWACPNGGGGCPG